MVFSLCRSRLEAWKDRLRGKLLTPGTGAALTGWRFVSLQAAFLSSSNLAAVTVSAAVDRYARQRSVTSISSSKPARAHQTDTESFVSCSVISLEDPWNSLDELISALNYSSASFTSIPSPLLSSLIFSPLFHPAFFYSYPIFPTGLSIHLPPLQFSSSTCDSFL